MKTTMKQSHNRMRLSLFCLTWALCAAAAATQLTYYPVNPSFGGSPLNGPMLLNNAQAQNKYTDESSDDLAAASGFQERTPLQDFNDSLQRSILSRVASSATSQILDPNSGKLHEGTIDTVDFTISVVNVGGGVLKITTTDKATGGQTSFQVGQ